MKGCQCSLVFIGDESLAGWAGMHTTSDLDIGIESIYRSFERVASSTTAPTSHCRNIESMTMSTFCELFVVGTTDSRESLLALIEQATGGPKLGFSLTHEGIEFEVRNNPRRKGVATDELERLETNPENGFVYSPDTIEVEPIDEQMDSSTFVSVVRPIIDALRNSGFSVHISSDLEAELKT